MSCEELRELAPMIALGTIEGEERAEALRHLATCADCRRLVDQLSEVADELLLIAPMQEPPAGFESRVVDALGPQRRRQRRVGMRVLRWLGPPVAAAAVSAVALVAVYHDDRVTAERYRETLAQADGQYFQAEPLRDATGTEAGVVFGYQGRPSWMLVTVDESHRARVSSAELVTRDRRTVPLAAFELDPRNGSWGGAIPVNLYDVAAIRLLGERPGEVLEAAVPHGTAPAR
jgi:predicted anti-sigma-YlaC factor YlaD